MQVFDGSLQEGDRIAAVTLGGHTFTSPITTTRTAEAMGMRCRAGLDVQRQAHTVTGMAAARSTRVDSLFSQLPPTGPR